MIQIFISLDFSNRVSPVDNNIKSLPVLIKHGAFIGASSLILKGVTVGEYSIIAPGSVVTKIYRMMKFGQVTLQNF